VFKAPPARGYHDCILVPWRLRALAGAIMRSYYRLFDPLAISLPSGMEREKL
jgi:hypothetical protein